MRVSAVQLAVLPESRSATLQAALRAVDTAAEREPAPELIVLPAFLDTVVDGHPPYYEPSRGPSTAACGFRARSQGVLIVMGMSERARPLPYLTGLLMDGDGDVRIIQRQKSVTGETAALIQAGDEHCAADTLLGRVSVLAGGDITDESAWEAVIARGAQLVAGTMCGSALKPAAFEKALSSLTAKYGCPCVVADVVLADGRAGFPGLTRIFDANGNIETQAHGNSAGIISADVTLRPAKHDSESQTVH